MTRHSFAQVRITRATHYVCVRVATTVTAPGRREMGRDVDRPGVLDIDTVGRWEGPV